MTVAVDPRVDQGDVRAAEAQRRAAARGRGVVQVAAGWTRVVISSPRTGVDHLRGAVFVRAAGGRHFFWQAIPMVTAIYVEKQNKPVKNHQSEKI